MKIFTQTYDLAKASPHRFWVAPFSEFKIGIKILEKDEISSKDFTLKAGSIEFTPDADKIDNFTLFTIKSNDTGFVDYTIEVEGVAEKLKLMQIVTDSTVFEVGGEGGDVPADVATQTWVNSQISDFVEEDALTAYATKDELTAYAETVDLTAFYTKSETNGLLSAKADATKQLPADLTSWITDGSGWYAEYDDPEGYVESRDFTKLTAGFYDISPYCDYSVSAQYVDSWDGYYYTTRLFSYCTNGKTVFCHQLDGSVMGGTDYEGNISGNLSCYFEVDTTKIPDGASLGSYLHDSSVVDEGSVKWFAYVSQNMDGNAPYTLQELTTFGDNDPLQIGDQRFYHTAFEDVTPGFVEVSAVYDNQISSKVDQQYLQDNYMNAADTSLMITDEVANALEDYYTKSETSSATEIGTALEGKQPAGNYLTAETDPAFNTWLSGEAFGIGYGTQIGSRAIAIGYATKANAQYSVAIGGPNCTVGVNGTGAIQLGSGSNNVANTFKVFNYTMLSSDGKIPNERLHLSAVSESDWATLSGSADAGTFYFVY